MDCWRTPVVGETWMAMGAAGCNPGEVPMLEPAEEPSPKGCELMEADWPASMPPMSRLGMGIPLFAACSIRICCGT